jgi:hypothetical protein
MGKPETSRQFSLEISDVSGQKVFTVDNAPADGTIGALIHQMVEKMNLPLNDASGARLPYQARSEREGRLLNASELIGDALQPGDRVKLQPDIDAGLAH